jgi:hypothetical protein
MPFKILLDTRFRGYDEEGIQHFLSLRCPFLKKCRCSIMKSAKITEMKDIFKSRLPIGIYTHCQEWSAEDFARPYPGG